MSKTTTTEIELLKNRLAEEAVKSRQAQTRLGQLERHLALALEENKKLSIALGDSEKQKKAFFNAASDTIILIEPETVGLVDFNTMAHNNLGYSREEFGKLEFQDFDNVWSNKEMRLLCAEILRDGDRSFKSRHRSKDGKIHNIKVNATRIGLKGKNLIQCVCTDIISHKQTKNELQDSKEKYRDLFHNSQVGLSRTRVSDGKLLETNDRLASMFGYKDRRQMLDEFYAPSAYEYQRDREYMLQTIIKDGEIQDYEVFARRRDGSNIWVRYSARLYPDEGYLDVVVVDITNEKKAEKEKDYLYTQLAQSQKMEAVGRLSGGIAHDFNNLLTVIKTMAYKSKKEVDKDSALHRYITLIDTAAEGARNLTQKLLIFSKKQSTTFITLDLNDLIEDLLEMLQSLLGSKIKIELVLSGDLFPIYGDKGSFEQVIINLAINARDAMAEGGSLKITTENMIDDRAKTFNMVSITVADTGTGMDEETSRRIFEPFFTTKPPGEGTGLGASVVYGIVKDHMGRIEVISTPGEGTSVNILLTPSHEKAPLTDQKAAARNIDISGMGEQILLVEDNTLIRETTSLLLSDYNYLVTSAASAEHALELFGKDACAFDLVLSDVVLPGKSGVELASILLLQKPELPILLCSGYTSKKLQWEEIQEKGLAFIRKPYDSTELLRKIRENLPTSTASPLQALPNRIPAVPEGSIT